MRSGTAPPTASPSARLSSTGPSQTRRSVAPASPPAAREKRWAWANVSRAASPTAVCAMKSASAPHAEARAGASPGGRSAESKMVNCTPKRSPAADARLPVTYHHSVLKPSCGPWSAGKVNARGASARA